ncbi:MAG: Flp family type IVb pilin [Planctomycetota bacterium]
MFIQSFRSAIARFVADEDGTTAVEYAVMLALIIAVCIGSVGVMADATVDSFNQSGAAIEGAFAN